MATRTFLVFSLHGSLFAVDALIVCEIIYLPELTPIEEEPEFISGVFNLRGKIVPVIDLNLLFGHARGKYNISDRVIVLGDKGLTMGIIVNDVHDVKNIPEEDIEPLSSIIRTLHTGLRIPHFVVGEAKVGEDIIMILDHDAILDFGLRIEELEETEKSEIEIPKSKIEETSHPAFAGISPEEKAVFHERALRYMQAVEEEGLAGLMPVAVVGLGGEYFSVELELVREFADMQDIVPVPCCPEHIIGNMNLRGDILTLIDIRGMLNLPLFDKSSIRTPQSKIEGKVIVTRIGELFAGVPVDEVFDVRYVNQFEISEVPSAIKAKNEEIIKGTVPYGGRMMTILNLSRILTMEDLVVNEEA